MKKMILKSYLRHVPQSEPTHSATREYVQQHNELCISSEASRQTNKNVHFEVKPHGYGVCVKTNKTNSNLCKHDKTHADEKPYQCEICKKSFSRKWNLNRHKLTTHDNVKSYKCVKCEKSFTQRINLLQHITGKHDGKKPYKCDQCVATFVYLASLCNHRKTHTGEKHFCDICSKAFISKSNRDRHRRFLHDVKKL